MVNEQNPLDKAISHDLTYDCVKDTRPITSLTFTYVSLERLAVIQQLMGIQMNHKQFKSTPLNSDSYTHIKKSTK